MEETNASELNVQTPVQSPAKTPTKAPKKKFLNKKWVILGLILLVLIFV